jgi:hypothetical protein
VLDELLLSSLGGLESFDLRNHQRVESHLECDDLLVDGPERLDARPSRRRLLRPARGRFGGPECYLSFPERFAASGDGSTWRGQLPAEQSPPGDSKVSATSTSTILAWADRPPHQDTTEILTSSLVLSFHATERGVILETV